MTDPDRLAELVRSVVDSLDAGRGEAGSNIDAAIRALGLGKSRAAGDVAAAIKAHPDVVAALARQVARRPAVVAPVKIAATLESEGARIAAEAATRADDEAGERDPEQRASDVEIADGWERRRREAERLAPGPYGQLLWVDQQCAKAGNFPLDEWWKGFFRKFYASGKRKAVVRAGLRACKSESIPRDLVAAAGFEERELAPNQIGVVPIISVAAYDAADRLRTLRAILHAIGLEDHDGRRGGVQAGGYRKADKHDGIAMLDSQGHPIEFRVYAATGASVVGYTAIGGMVDELDKWRNAEDSANRADRLLEELDYRFTTQPAARLYLCSATYEPGQDVDPAESAHAKLIRLGDTPDQYVARLGSRGARLDQDARFRLVALAGPDPLLLEAADPRSTDIPTWVGAASNRNLRPTPIERCYEMAGRDVRRMLARFGGRLDLVETTAEHEPTADEIERFRKLVATVPGSRYTRDLR